VITNKGLLTATRSEMRQSSDCPLEPPEVLPALLATDFRLLAARTAREYISILSSHQVYGNFLQLTQETSTRRQSKMALLGPDALNRIGLGFFGIFQRMTKFRLWS
jgi:hypothetical protein